MSAAVRGSASGSTFSNHDLNTRVMGGVEYDVFPYSESTRRSLTVSYMAGVAHNNVVNPRFGGGGGTIIFW